MMSPLFKRQSQRAPIINLLDHFSCLFEVEVAVVVVVVEDIKQDNKRAAAAAVREIGLVNCHRLFI